MDSQQKASDRSSAPSLCRYLDHGNCPVASNTFSIVACLDRPSKETSANKEGAIWHSEREDVLRVCHSHLLPSGHVRLKMT